MSSSRSTKPNSTPAEGLREFESLAARLRDWIQQNEDRILNDLIALGQLDAPSRDLEALEENGRLFEEIVSRAHGRIRRWPTPAGTHFEIRFGPATPDPILMLGHYDTVWPAGTARDRPIVKDGEILRGPGVFDMRGGVIAALSAVAALESLGELRKEVIVCLTADEEVGSGTSEDLIVRLGEEARAVLVPEPPMPDGGMKTRRKGVRTYRVEVVGRSAHAGLDPERGISAIHVLLSLCERVRGRTRIEEGTSVNIGVLWGGTRSNVVAERATCQIDVRVDTVAEYYEVDRWFRGLAGSHQGAQVDVRLLNERPPMQRTPAVAGVAARTQEIAQLVGLALGEGQVGGGSDGNLLVHRGIAVADGLGPVGNGAHAVDEYIRVDSLLERVALLALLAVAL